MKNKTLAIFGIGTYILSVISSATDSAGNSVVPSVLILISGLASLAFLIMAAMRLWKSARVLTVIFVVSSVILSIAAFGEGVFFSYGTTTILVLNLVKAVAFIAAILVVIKLFKTSDVDWIQQRAMAKELYGENPDLAMRITIGEERAPNGLLPAVVYAHVCAEAEKSEKLDVMMKIANSHRNTKLSADAKFFKLRDPYAPIEAMKEVVNARREAFEKTLPKGKTYEMALNEEVEKIREFKPFFALCVFYFKFLLDSEEEIAAQIKEIQLRTKQNLLEEKLFRELRALRFVFLHSWFFDLRPPQNQEDLNNELFIINSALKSVLKDRNKLDYLPCFEKALTEYFNSDELNFKNLQYFKDNFGEHVAEKLTRAAFDSTEGRLAGELHDFVTGLLMTTIEGDKKFLFDQAA